ncbi:hypothetical protein [Povalibacter sp.]|uniref:hypothetical protein n=1 Tax=Povalibacter sp. TaxID=1962978 RepID=UPI002F3E5934
MNTSPLLSALIRSLTAMALLSGTAMTLAAEPATAPPAPSKEMRAEMATIHENMAACLRSDKAFSACQQQMHQSCAQVMGEKGCPMMGMSTHKRAMMPKQE